MYGRRCACTLFRSAHATEPVVLGIDGQVRPEASQTDTCASISFPLKPLLPILPQDQYVCKLLSFPSLVAPNTPPIMGCVRHHVPWWQPLVA